MSARTGLPPPARPAGHGRPDRRLPRDARPDLRGRARDAQAALRVHRGAGERDRRRREHGLLGGPVRHRRAHRPRPPRDARRDHRRRHVPRRHPAHAAVPDPALPRGSRRRGDRRRGRDGRARRGSAGGSSPPTSPSRSPGSCWPRRSSSSSAPRSAAQPASVLRSDDEHEPVDRQHADGRARASRRRPHSAPARLAANPDTPVGPAGRRSPRPIAPTSAAGPTDYPSVLRLQCQPSQAVDDLVDRGQRRRRPSPTGGAGRRGRAGSRRSAPRGPLLSATAARGGRSARARSRRARGRPSRPRRRDGARA